MVDLLNFFYPERAVTVTTSDPPYITPAVDALLRRKNRLMHAGRTEQAGAVAAPIRTAITRSSMKRMRKVDTRKSTKDAWAKVREVIKGPENQADDYATGLTAQLFNDHYAAISTDNNYKTPRSKVTASDNLLHHGNRGVSDAGYTADDSDWS